jgi:hypothetical protein
MVNLDYSEHSLPGDSSRQSSKMVLGLGDEEYRSRLTELGILTLEERRHQSDMHMIYKIKHGHRGLDSAVWFDQADNVAHHATRTQLTRIQLKGR